jgi:hypothetical protein
LEKLVKNSSRCPPIMVGGIWGSLEFSWDSKVSSTMPWAKGLSFQSQSPGSLEV